MRRLSFLAGIVILLTSMKLMISSPHGDNFHMNCDDCHTTGDWKINPDSVHFSHDTTAMPLKGQHTKTGCRQCHQSLVFTDADPFCATCHTDMHENTVGQECDRCHNQDSWIITDLIGLHRQTRFPLLGAHSMADCQQCHSSASLLRFEPLGIECYDCHRADYEATTSPDHQNANYSKNCAECHFINSFTWAGAGINHDFFPLKEGHDIDDCTKCHTDGNYGNISPTCVSCHQQDYNAANNPNHTNLQFPTDCNQCHSLAPGWSPANFTSHDAQFFPIYLGQHNGEWETCADCHKNSSDYGIFTCTDCHEHEQGDMDDEHDEVSGYSYNSLACYGCHPTGSAEGSFNHSSTAFPLTGAHTGAACLDCHSSGYAGTSTFCYDCHTDDFTQSQNPNHAELDIPNTCADCHTTDPGWSPATFAIHNQYYSLNGAHQTIDCSSCHETGIYSGTPNTCAGCHLPDYNQTTDPPHASAQFSTECLQCHTEVAWQSATFNHDAEYFPIYSGEHNGQWDQCSDCHFNQSNYAQFSCIACHEHNQTDMDDKHSDVTGYQYTSSACLACHPDGSATGAFNHNNTSFPLTGAHTGALCTDCHTQGYTGTTTICYDCHTTDYTQSVNPSHNSLGLPHTCADCHTTNPGWAPATFTIHNQYYALNGAHSAIASECATCHNGNYTTTPNTCAGCHMPEYNQTTNPSHSTAQFPTDCIQCHTEIAWLPSTFNHDGMYFPIYSGEHQGEWTLCSDCHDNPSNYAVFTCLTCHEQTTTGQQHTGITGYIYNSPSCFACHPDGSATGAFNHNNTSFPLTGAHTGASCIDCHPNGYTGTSSVCFDCHGTDFDQSANPSHTVLNIPNTCADCHTTNPGWAPATFPIHDQYYALTGAHAAVASECATCHNGNYNSTPNTCDGCHMPDYTQSTNPSHTTLDIPTTCAQCHTTNPGWAPATFPIHDQYYALTGAHAAIANECATCHNGNYNSTPNTCEGCHMPDYTQSTNPSHTALDIPTTCAQCHTTIPGWAPAAFPIHNQYYQLNGAHAAIASECASCHNGNYNNTPNTCAGCHINDYNQTTDPPHASAQYPTDCLLCHTEIAWIPSTFDHDNQYFPIYSGQHLGEWNTCSDCHPNPSNFAQFTCLTCHEQAETNADHLGVSGYSYNSNACLQCHPDGNSKSPVRIQRIKIE